VKAVVCSFLTLALLANPSNSTFASLQNQENAGRQEAPPLDIANFTVEQTFQSNFTAGHGYDPKYQFNNCTNTWHNEIDAARRTQLNDNWYLRIGIDAARYDFGDNRSEAPNILQSYAMQLGLECFQKGELGFIVQSNPGLYFSHQLDRRDFDAPTKIELFHPVVNDQFYLVCGARLSLQSNYPILPIAGVLWHIDSKCDLQAYLPAPRLVYHYRDALDLWVGGEITGSSFRYDNTGKVDYYEIRTGTGMDYSLNKILTVNFAIGLTVVRNFVLPHSTEETYPTPYAKLALNMAF